MTGNESGNLRDCAAGHHHFGKDGTCTACGHDRKTASEPAGIAAGKAQMMESLLRQALNDWPEFGTDEDVRGADLVQWFADWYERVRQQIDGEPGALRANGTRIEIVLQMDLLVNEKRLLDEEQVREVAMFRLPKPATPRPLVALPPIS